MKVIISATTKTLNNTVGFAEGFFTAVPAFRQGHLHISPVDLEGILQNADLYTTAPKGSAPTVAFNGRTALVTQSAKQALDLALSQFHLQPQQEVWIITTTDNTYISSCVTQTIEKHCKWSRTRTGNTALILVNHEFGFCYQALQALQQYNLPIIEDAAYSMYSNNAAGTAGTIGDYVIYSLAKMFPVPSGGLLVANHAKQLPNSPLGQEELDYYHAVFTHYHAQKNAICAQRRAVYQSFCAAFSTLGFVPRFALQPHDVPGAFLFRAPDKDLNHLKIQLQQLGIECSVFYGEATFYLPCHQKMNKNHVTFLATLVKTILK